MIKRIKSETEEMLTYGTEGGEPESKFKTGLIDSYNKMKDYIREKWSNLKAAVMRHKVYALIIVGLLALSFVSVIAQEILTVLVVYGVLIGLVYITMDVVFTIVYGKSYYQVRGFNDVV